MSEYPEHDKLRAIRDKSQAIGEFLDWLEEGGLDHSPLAKRDNPILVQQSVGCVELAFRCECLDGSRSSVLDPLMIPKTRLLAAFFEIDERALEAEKRAMIDKIRKAACAPKIRGEAR